MELPKTTLQTLLRYLADAQTFYLSHAQKPKEYDRARQLGQLRKNSPKKQQTNKHMYNFSIKLNLLQLRGAFMLNMKGRAATKLCLVIPVEDANLFAGQKGTYLDLAAFAVRNPQYGDTHCVKQSLDRLVRQVMTNEERKAQPIIGNMRPLRQEPQEQAIPAAGLVDSDDDLPF